jgi:hephaestin
LEFIPADGEGNASFLGSGFTVANTKFAINGYIYGTGPMMVMKRGERVRWYLLDLGEFVSSHTPHWHGNVVLHDGKHTDVITLMQAEMETADMVPDNPGICMFHCHIDDHMDAGMATLYKVEP